MIEGAFQDPQKTKELRGGGYTPRANCMNIKTGELRQKEAVRIWKQRANDFALVQDSFLRGIQ
jgi:hypothetical protein